MVYDWPNSMKGGKEPEVIGRGMPRPAGGLGSAVRPPHPFPTAPPGAPSPQQTHYASQNWSRPSAVGPPLGLVGRAIGLAAKQSRAYSQANTSRYRGLIPLVGKARASQEEAHITVRRVCPEGRWTRRVDRHHRLGSMITPRRKVPLQRSQRSRVTTMTVTHLHLARVRSRTCLRSLCSSRTS